MRSGMRGGGNLNGTERDYCGPNCYTEIMMEIYFKHHNN